MHTRSALPALLLTISALPASGATIAPHPAVSPYAGSVATRRDDDGFRRYALVTAVDPAGKTDEAALKTLAVEGNVTRLAYENPPGRSGTEVFANYRQALEKAGYQVLFACQAAECGPSFATSRWTRVTGMRYAAPDMGYLAARSGRGTGDVYVAVLVASRRHHLEVVEARAMETGLVTATDLADGLKNEGRVVLDGLFFDTDKATLTAESRPALEVIAAFLRDNPDIQVYIVGHTDGTGGFDYNLKLSRDRAAAVVAELTANFGIAGSRLAAHGVGPLVPVRSNAAEAGRAANRRVEMVQR
jgi:outer membrane protein OmpA-like peptidoglycan-associated protein